MLRGGIVGLGNVAVHGHLPGWLSRADVLIAAAADAVPARREALTARIPAARWFDSAVEMMDAAGLDFVDICTPPSSHGGLIEQALRRGLHVICEKPLVGSPAELAELAARAAARGRALHTVHNWHHAPIVRRAQELVADGAIGPVTGATWRTLRTRPAAAAAGADNWRVDPAVSGGGVLTDHGWHVSYLLQRWFGGPPVAVSARLETRRHTEWAVEDTAALRLRFPDGSADVLLTWAADQRGNWAEIAGGDGAIELADETLILRRGGSERRWSFDAGLSDGSQHPDWFHAVAEQFLADVAGGAGPGANLAEASACVAIEALARESDRRGGAELPLSAAWTSASRPELAV